MVPEALQAGLWGALAGLLRFVPYVGVMVAGATIAVFIAAIDPGWQLAVTCLGLFLVLERWRLGEWLARRPRLLQHLYALGVVVIGWVLFREASLPAAGTYLAELFGFASGKSAE